MREVQRALAASGRISMSPATRSVVVGVAPIQPHSGLITLLKVLTAMPRFPSGKGSFRKTGWPVARRAEGW
jgi:hypothetical protein